MFAIKDMRMKKGLSQAETARLSGMLVRRYGSYEREERMLSLEDACKLADVFGCTLDELAGRTPPRAGGQIEGLTGEEGALVGAYRLMDGGDRPSFIQMARTLAYAGEAKKEELAADARVAGVGVT